MDRAFIYTLCITLNFIFGSVDTHGQTNASTEGPPKNISFKLPLMPLAKALPAFGLQAKVSVVAPHGLLEDKTSSPLIGAFTLEQALKKLLWRSSLDFDIRKAKNHTTVYISAQTKLMTENNIETTEPITHTEEIIVTGIKASYLRSMDLKRNSTTIVDAVSAEDIAKFPDNNIAESLQRIPGVAISRDNGEGTTINIRGLDENYTTVTLNGRTLPAAIAPANEAAESRAFDFSTIAAQAIKNVMVYKTSRARDSTGGIGATIDITTFKPLDQTGLRQHIGVKGVQHSSNPGFANLTPELSGLLSWANDKYGASISFINQKTKQTLASAEIDNWHLLSDTEFFNLAAVKNGRVTLENIDDTARHFALPDFITYKASETEINRLNAQFTLQYQPNNLTTLTFDLTRFEKSLKKSIDSQEVSLLFDRGVISLKQGDITIPELIFAANTSDDENAWIKFANQSANSTSTIDSLGLNLSYKPSDRLTFTMDTHSSSASSGPLHSNNGSSTVISTSADVVELRSIDFRSKLPIVELQIDSSANQENGGNYGLISSSDLQLDRVSGTNSEQESSIHQININGSLTLDDLNISFGIDYRDMKSKMFFSTGSYAPYSEWINFSREQTPDYLLSPKNFASLFNNYNTWSMFSKGYKVNALQTLRWLENYDTEELNDYPLPLDLNHKLSVATDRSTAEIISAIFIQAEWSANINDILTQAILGVRAETTRVTAQNSTSLPLQYVWTEQFYVDLERSETRESVKEKSNYSNLLPSIDISIELSAQIKTRLHYGESISRPSYSQLESAQSSFHLSNTSSRPESFGGIEVQRGNPTLRPIESTNLDLALEWYPSNKSYFSLVYFNKKVGNLVERKYSTEPHLNLRDPTRGPKVDLARQALSSDEFLALSEREQLAAIFNYIVANENNDPGQDSLHYQINYDIYPEEESPLLEFPVTTYTNSQHTTFRGYELSMQHFFGESGYGISGNYTKVNGGTHYNNLSIDNIGMFSLFGLSDSMNIVAIYDKNKLQARLSYNWRGNHLKQLKDIGYPTRDPQTRSSPTFAAPRAQIDLSIHYLLNENTSILFEGINIAESDNYSYARARNQLRELELLGARYQFGIRYSF